MPEIVIVSDYAGELFGRQVAERLRCQYVHVRVHPYFPDGEPDIKVTENIRGRGVYFVCPYQPNPIQRMAEIELINSTLRDSSAATVVDVATYLGFMKKDWKDDARVPISIRTVAQSIELYADSVLTIDMHSPQIQGMFRIPLDHLDGTVLFAKHAEQTYEGVKDMVVASPDIGGAKRAQRLAERVGAQELAIVYKMRDPNTREVTSKGVIGNVDGRDVIFIDDQAVSCESLVEAANLVRDYGARRIFAYCTHGLMVPKKGLTAEQRLADSLIEKLYITDTIPRPDSYFDAHEKIELVSCVDLFAEAIRRVHNNESLSALFKQPRLTQ